MMTVLALLFSSSTTLAMVAIAPVRSPPVLAPSGILAQACSRAASIVACSAMPPAEEIGEERLSKRGLRRRRKSGAKRGDDGKTSRRAGTGVPQQQNPAAPADESPLRVQVRQLIRQEQPQKALELYEEQVASDADAYPAVTRALLKMRRVELALALYRRHSRELSLDVDTRSAVTLFLALCRTRRLADAIELFNELGSAYPTPEHAVWVGGAATAVVSPGDVPEDEPVWHARGSVMLPSLILAQLGEGDVPSAARLALQLGQPAACIPEVHVMTKLIREFGKNRCLRGVYACLDAQATAGQDADADGLQAMVDALVRSCRFVKGGVSMDTLPTSALPEIAFIGRSNVGKSSMVNMILGRRALAYTSKTPGKTQQYNYFVLNEPTDGPFHVVDMPGLGYAKVPGAERKKWLAFLEEYAAQRSQLKLIVHLVDGQVGPLETDVAIMRMVCDAYSAASAGADRIDGEEPRPQWSYAVCLTKSDKGGPKAIARAEEKVLQAVAEAECPQPIAIVPTSSKSKAGRAGMWRLFRHVALHGESEGE